MGAVTRSMPWADGYNTVMKSEVLYNADEETDDGAYRQYLRAQTDDDLFDIAQHLDQYRYPARCDAARREIDRRRVVPIALYTSNEYLIRNTALFGFALAGATIALSALLTADITSSTPWPTAIPNNCTALHAVLIYATAVLRGVVVWSVHLGLYDIALGTLAYWTISRGFRLLSHRARTDVWQFAAAATVALAAAILIASGPCSAVPDLFSSGSSLRPFTLLNPLGLLAL